MDHVYPDSRGRPWHFAVYELKDGWYWEMSAESPDHPDSLVRGPFVRAEEALAVAQLWIEGRETP
jgi:hypothetical protein